MTTAVAPAAHATDRTRPLKILCSVICCLVLAGVVRTTLHWDGASGVLDGVCYMRQAHLFQRFGLGGFDTDIARDDDHYLTSKLREIDYPTWNDLTTAPCHTLMRSGKHVIQYPPGTGFTLALFPPGYQLVSIYVVSTAVLLGFALLAIAAARTAPSALLAGEFDRHAVPVDAAVCVAAATDGSGGPWTCGEGGKRRIVISSGPESTRPPGRVLLQ
jgi:hypothetical protein